MSLMRLLSAGKSLVGVKDNGSRYRMGNPGMLPRFGSQKNPFAREQKGNAENDGAGPTRAPNQSVTNHAPIQPSTEVPRAASPQPAVPRQQGEDLIRNTLRKSSLQKKVRIPRAWHVALRPTLTAWAKKIKTAMLRQQGTPRRKVITHASRKPVQAELSLDRIKVVRNDLSDTDFEVIPGGTARSSLAERKIEMRPKSQPASRIDASPSRQFSGLRHEVENQTKAKGEMGERMMERTVSPPFALANGIPHLSKATPRAQQAQNGNLIASLSASGPGWFSAVNR